MARSLRSAQKELTYVDIEENLEFAKLNLQKYSLSDGAKRKAKLLNLSLGGSENSRNYFPRSTLIETNEQGADLYYSLPSHCLSKDGAEVMIYSSSDSAHAHEQEFAISALREALLGAAENGNPTVFVFKSGEYTFGAFTPTAWQTIEELKVNQRSE